MLGSALTVSEVRRHRALLWSIFRSHEFACVDEVERSNTFLTSSGSRLALTMTIQNGRHFHFGALPRLTNPAKHLLPKVQSQLHLQSKPVHDWEKNGQVPNAFSLKDWSATAIVGCSTMVAQTSTSAWPRRWFVELSSSSGQAREGN